jgi:mannose-1-phosphate guanylyltransferase
MERSISFGISKQCLSEPMSAQKIYAVIMAGGSGTRFWPRSREKSPKQVLEIVGSGSMIFNTVARIQSLVPPEQTLVVTNKLQQPIIQQQLPQLPKENILVEPVGRNTAPCIALAAQWIANRDPEAIMVVLPADHLIRKPEEFLRVLRVSIDVATNNDALVTIGIQPTHPETGYGYIQFDDSPNQNPYYQDAVYRVKTESGNCA